MKEKSKKLFKDIFNIFVAILLISGILLPVIIVIFSK
jgi:hypothetical protein